MIDVDPLDDAHTPNFFSERSKRNGKNLVPEYSVIRAVVDVF